MKHKQLSPRLIILAGLAAVTALFLFTAMNQWRDVNNSNALNSAPKPDNEAVFVSSEPSGSRPDIDDSETMPVTDVATLKRKIEKPREVNSDETGDLQAVSDGGVIEISADTAANLPAKGETSARDLQSVDAESRNDWRSPLESAPAADLPADIVVTVGEWGCPPDDILNRSGKPMLKVDAWNSDIDKATVETITVWLSSQSLVTESRPQNSQAAKPDMVHDRDADNGKAGPGSQESSYTDHIRCLTESE